MNEPADRRSRGPSPFSTDRPPGQAEKGTVPLGPGFVRLCRGGDIPEGGRQVFEVDDRYVVVFHQQGRFYALDDRCTHDGGPLGEGTLEGFVIECPRHGAKFDIRDGRVLAMPAACDTPSHEVELRGDEVWVRLKD